MKIHTHLDSITPIKSPSPIQPQSKLKNPFEPRKLDMKPIDVSRTKFTDPFGHLKLDGIQNVPENVPDYAQDYANPLKLTLNKTLAEMKTFPELENNWYTIDYKVKNMPFMTNFRNAESLNPSLNSQNHVSDIMVHNTILHTSENGKQHNCDYDQYPYYSTTTKFEYGKLKHKVAASSSRNIAAIPSHNITESEDPDLQTTQHSHDTAAPSSHTIVDPDAPDDPDLQVTHHSHKKAASSTHTMTASKDPSLQAKEVHAKHEGNCHINVNDSCIKFENNNGDINEPYMNLQTIDLDDLNKITCSDLKSILSRVKPKMSPLINYNTPDVKYTPEIEKYKDMLPPNMVNAINIEPLYENLPKSPEHNYIIISPIQTNSPNTSPDRSDKRKCSFDNYQNAKVPKWELLEIPETPKIEDVKSITIKKFESIQIVSNETNNSTSCSSDLSDNVFLDSNEKNVPKTNFSNIHKVYSPRIPYNSKFQKLTSCQMLITNHKSLENNENCDFGNLFLTNLIEIMKSDKKFVTAIESFPALENHSGIKINYKCITSKF